MDLFRPITAVRRGKTIQYDRSPRRPGVVAIAIGIVVALMVLALVWAQLTFLGGHTAATVPRGTSGHASASRRKAADQADGPDLMSVGGANEELATTAHQWWIETAAKTGIDLAGFDPHAPLAERIAWATQAGLEIAVVLSRFSSKLQHSTRAQVQHTVEFAGHHKTYVPPEFLCVDEAEKGRRVRRDGLERAKAILHNRQAQTLLVFKVSRLLRTGYKSFQFVNEEVVEEGLRAVSTSQGIDTRDEKTWKALMYLHGMMDEMLLDTIADHCRAGLKTLFEQGYTTGALTVGYRRVDVPGAPLTNRKLPRTMPQIVMEVAQLIRQHYKWIHDGMTIKEGWRRWLAAGGPCDPRSINKSMSYQAYRRMLSNPRYLGCWAFGRKRNRWSSKLDYTQQVDGPEAELAIHRCEDLRILDDELFFAVQARLAEFRQGPRGPHKQKKDIHLWDLVTEFFHCVHCKVRFYQTGANGKGMQCKRGDLCPCKSAVRRKEAVQAICKELAEVIQRDADLIRRIICRGRQIDFQGDDQLQAEISTKKAEIQAWTNKIDDLEELSGQGSEEDRRRRKAMINAATAKKATLQVELTHLEKRLGGGAARDHSREDHRDPSWFCHPSGECGQRQPRRRRGLQGFRHLPATDRGADLGPCRAATGRKGTNVRGVFTPQLLRTVTEAVKVHDVTDGHLSEEVSVWLREPPRLDALAERVHQLIDIDDLSFREAAKVLQTEGHKVNSGNVWYSYRRYYEMRGLPVPNRPYNNGRPRKSG